MLPPAIIYFRARFQPPSKRSPVPGKFLALLSAFDELLNMAIRCVVFCFVLVVGSFSSCREAAHRGACGFQEVIVKSEPGDGGYAFKSLRFDGLVRAGHLSGGGPRPLVHEEEGEASHEVRVQVERLIETLCKKTPRDIQRPDSHKGGLVSVTVIFRDERSLTFFSFGREGFQNETLQSLSEIVSSLDYGNW